ncbi:hypothetical protein [Spirillospora sp. CA-294931]|uniref:bestrophin-like domain n=1 Tax=Spirillospora sp. CA-294931 TaxID=3240042 RepID=UPI003D950108
MSTLLAALLVIFGAGAGAALVALPSHRVVSRRVRHELGAYGTLVSVLAVGAFGLSVLVMLVSAWAALYQADQSTNREASALDGLYWYSSVVGGDEGTAMRARIRDYTTEVVRVEWTAMDTTGDLTARGWQIVNDLHYRIERLSPKPGGESERYRDALNAADALIQARRERASLARMQFPGVMWFALIGSGLLVTLIPIMRGNPHPPVRAALAFVAAATVAFSAFLMYQLNQPFSGSVSVSAAAFEAAFASFDDIDELWARRP